MGWKPALARVRSGRALALACPAGGRHQHHRMYDETSLRALLLDVGFSRVDRTSYRQRACPDLEILDNRPESLFVEAFK